VGGVWFMIAMSFGWQWKKKFKKFQGSMATTAQFQFVSLIAFGVITNLCTKNGRRQGIRPKQARKERTQPHHSVSVTKFSAPQFFAPRCLPCCPCLASGTNNHTQALDQLLTHR
jgi:hypothetical protein